MTTRNLSTRTRFVLGLVVATGALVGLATLDSFGLKDGPAGNPPAAAPRPTSPNVFDFGAVGDGKADDTAAIRRAIEAICTVDDGRSRARRLVVSPGTYRLTGTIVLTPENNHLVIECPGGEARLVWDGPRGGNMIETWAQRGLQMRDLVLDGAGKAGTLLRVNSTDGKHENQYLKRFGQRAATAYTLERLKFMKADTGVSFGDESYINSDLCTLSHCGFSRLETGIRMKSVQNLGFFIPRPDFGYVGTALWITGGGYVTVTLLNAHHTDVAIRLEGQGINSGVFKFDGVRPEQGSRTPGKRPVLLMASGETNVHLTAAQTTTGAIFGENGDLDTPAFILGPSANVVVESSHITGKVARLTGKADDVPTFLTIRNSRFRCGSDPRTGIEADRFSGYRIVDSVVTVDDVRGKAYKVSGRVMIPEMVHLPKQAQGQPGYKAP
ncbi:MAG: glycosyl hydrolase family 28-related protein [Planctomycetota bacterium]